MKRYILFFILTITIVSYSQSVYEVTPGTKSNQVILSLSNISDIENAENVKVKITKHSQNLSFKKEEQLVERINSRNEVEASFIFDIKREAPVNSKDTIEFMITDDKTIVTSKAFIFSYAPPKEYKLEQNFPNPFNPTTKIQYQIPYDGRVTLKVYDILGSEVTTLIDEVQEAGYKEIFFNASSFSSGVYIYRLIAKDHISTKKMILLR